jgi:hypothetical protein
MRRIWAILALLAASMPARSETLGAVTVGGKGVLTICRSWIVHRSCKPYDKIVLPPRVAVGDKITLSFGSNPKDYVFHVVEIRPNGDGCILLSDESGGRTDGERIEVPSCQLAAKRPAGGG